MKRVIILHGWGGSPEEPMIKWLGEKLSKEGFETIIPEMPETDTPKIIPWVNKVKEIVEDVNEETYFIGHSVGCQTVLRFLETQNNKIGGVVFIAPWMKLDEETIREEGEEVIEIARPWEETPIDWKRVKKVIGKSICILSDNDPFVPLDNAELFKENLNAEIIIEHDKGHYTESDRIEENETALNKLIEISNN